SFGRPGRTLQPAWRFLSRPAVAWSIFVAVMWLWHLPMLYDAALRSPLLHAFEHACFLGAALLFWWPLLRPFGSRTASRPFAVPYLFLASLQGSALGAFITFAPRPLYSGYAVSVVSSLTPLQDQQLAGLIMWLPGSLFYLAVAALFFVAWLGRTGAPLAAPALLEGERS
ncbi:MAG TPA: cytochrome c oxidase assembly protein, partial [Deinococcales bacterium]|nr:cytochrome c oxidase assembly protein [Deinococcales bacterium]